MVKGDGMLKDKTGLNGNLSDAQEVIAIMQLVVDKAKQIIDAGRTYEVVFYHQDESDTPCAFVVTAVAADGTPSSQRVCMGICDGDPFGEDQEP